jgi:hypothetical protein
MLTITRRHETLDKTSIHEDNLAKAALLTNVKTLHTRDGATHTVRVNVAANVRRLRLRRECGERRAVIRRGGGVVRSYRAVVVIRGVVSVVVSNVPAGAASSGEGEERANPRHVRLQRELVKRGVCRRWIRIEAERCEGRPQLVQSRREVRRVAIITKAKGRDVRARR